jgi:hypothetical protein
MRATETNFAQCVRNLAEFTPWPDVAPRTAVITAGWQLSPDPVEAVLLGLERPEQSTRTTPCSTLYSASSGVRLQSTWIRMR